jgi:importin subunit beta-1
VRDTTAWTIGKICEFHKNALGAEVLPNLVTGLSNALSDSSAKVAAQACFAVHNLAQACSEEKDFPTNVISHFMPHMLEKLLGVASREDCEEENMRVSAYEATNMMVANSAEDMRPVVRQLLAEGLNRLEATFANTDAHERANLQSLLCSLVGACVHKLVAEDVTPVADRVMQLLLQVTYTCRLGKL